MSVAEGFRARELTPHGAGGIAVLALEGPGALARLAALAPAAALAPGRPVVVRLAHAGQDLDQAMAWIDTPARVEVHVHASPPLVRRVLDLVGGAARPPQARSLEERAQHGLADAACEAGARILLDQAEGALRRELDAIVARERGDAVRALAELSEASRIARHAIQPALVVVAGAVNAGKSTLFNALCGRERAIVSAVAGTTRDVVVERARFGAYAVDLADTAGARDLADDAAAELERRGQERGARVTQRADLVLWLDPSDAPAPPPNLGVPCARIVSRCDLAPRDALASSAPRVSALREPHAAAAAVHAAFRGALGLPIDPWRPGAGVAFDHRSREAVARALGRATGREAGDWREPLAEASRER